MKFFWEARKVILLSALVYLVVKSVFYFGFVSQYIEQITLYALIVILTSLGLNVIYGYTGQFSLGHAAFYGIGAYVSAYLTKVFGIENVFAYIPVLFVSGAAAGLAGYLIGIPILRLRDDFLAIATLGFGTFVRVILDNSDKLSEVLGGSRGFVGIPRLTTFELAFMVAIFLILVTRNLIFSRYGLFWRCIKSDELASASIGINTFSMKLMAFTYGCFLAGVGRALYANLYTFLHPSNFDIFEINRFPHHCDCWRHGQYYGDHLCRIDLGGIY